MSDDVHDIDDLFKKRLGDYAEETPPSAWEAINHALDKQQATLYKRKYNRLKSAAFLLLLLCCLGGVYVAFDVWKHTQSASEQTQKSAASSNEINQTLTDKKEGDANDITNKNNLQKKVEQKEKSITDKNIASDKSSLLSAQNKNEEAINTLKKKSASVASISSFLNYGKKKAFVVTDKNETKQNLTQQEETYQLSQPVALPDFLLQPFLLQKENKPVDVLALQTRLQNRKPASLSSANASSAIKIKEKAAHGFSLTLFASPNFSFEKINNDHHHDWQGGIGQERHSGNEENNFSFSGGALVNYQFNKNIIVQSGVAVTAFSTVIAPSTVYAKPDNDGHVRYQLNCSLGSGYLQPKGNAPLTAGDSTQTSSGTSKLVYINLPASVGYQINKGRFSILPAAGAGLNVLVDGKIKTSLGGAANAKMTTSINGLKRTYFNGSVGVGVEYKVSHKLSLGIRPNAKFTLTSINKEMPVKSYQNYLSVEAGVRMKL